MCIWNGNKYFGYDIDYTAKRIVNPDNGKPEYFVTCEIRSSCTGGMTMHEIGICPYKTALDSEKAITGPEEKCKEALTFFKKATVYMNATVGDLEDAEAACRPNTKEFQNWFSDYIAALKSWCSLFTTPPNAQTSFKIECCAPPNIGKPADSN